jgi:hypothetical protein
MLRPATPVKLSQVPKTWRYGAPAPAHNPGLILTIARDTESPIRLALDAGAAVSNADHSIDHLPNGAANHSFLMNTGEKRTNGGRAPACHPNSRITDTFNTGARATISLHAACRTAEADDSCSGIAGSNTPMPLPRLLLGFGREKGIALIVKYCPWHNGRIKRERVYAYTDNVKTLASL